MVFILTYNFGSHDRLLLLLCVNVKAACCKCMYYSNIHDTWIKEEKEGSGVSGIFWCHLLMI